MRGVRSETPLPSPSCRLGQHALGVTAGLLYLVTNDSCVCDAGMPAGSSDMTAYVRPQTGTRMLTNLAWLGREMARDNKQTTSKIINNSCTYTLQQGGSAARPRHWHQLSQSMQAREGGTSRRERGRRHPTLHLFDTVAGLLGYAAPASPA
ncbi:hypothetical protein GGR56DRAFT_470489 [Xylariaceae sp. FL0804]|nr:hypothetical protein GGR56DRAFT_470489 [Xylariaceae sp. FL0804]